MLNTIMCFLLNGVVGLALVLTVLGLFFMIKEEM